MRPLLSFLLSGAILLLAGCASEATDIERQWTGTAGEEPVLVIHDSLYNASRLHLHESGLYVRDPGDTRIKRFDREGHFLNFIGEGEGGGPGELRSILDAVVRDSVVWVVDGRARRLERFTLDGRYLSGQNVEGYPHRLASIGSNFALMKIETASPFETLDPEGTVLTSYGDTLRQIDPTGMATDGNLVPGGGNTLIYVPLYAGTLFYFDAEEGKLLQTHETADPRPFPEPEHSDRTIRAPRPDIRTRAAGTGNDEFYLYTYDSAEEARYLDRFDLETGAYIDTKRIPFGVGSLQMEGDRLYVSRDTAVYVYEID